MSFYTSLSGMRNAQASLGVIAHNIANSETWGFKRGRTEFSEIVAASAGSDPRMIEGIGATVSGVNQNFSLGPVEQTGASLDLAITGDGFFTTVSPTDGRTYYTRSGAFEISGTGHVTNSDGQRLQIFAADPGGAITTTTLSDAVIPAVNGAGSEFAGVTVGKDGVVRASYADGSIDVIGGVSLATFIAPNGLRSVGGSSWESTGLSGAANYGTPNTGRFGAVQSGALERSNVDIAEELVGLITAQRNFQANAKAIDTATQISQTAINLRT